MMDLKALLPASNIILDLAAKQRHELLTVLVSPLVSKGVIKDQAQFIADLEQRESQITTQIETAVALPHARSNAVRRLGLTVGIAPAPGIEYTPGAPELCRLFFLIAVPAFAPTAHLPLLQRLACFAHDRPRVEKLLASTSPARAARQLVMFKPKL
jgi:mannitol/fructose-specific phosphotransferase system IIA component (Ntr-type)